MVDWFITGGRGGGGGLEGVRPYNAAVSGKFNNIVYFNIYEFVKHKVRLSAFI